MENLNFQNKANKSISIKKNHMSIILENSLRHLVQSSSSRLSLHFHWKTRKKKNENGRYRSLGKELSFILDHHHQ
ncbi:hypothetical protein DERF_014334 [Dermatophagoides farinae]|uniref:Uncharacterized protein n=1 Tax=Dermatophagoides farinae TaxID=6954 RepID=A0A922HNV9_DERFA|nr:hypothetical protein DERF_014334 [Dermatophagoides farinae]